MSFRKFPTLPTGQLAATHQYSTGRWWHILSETQMVSCIDENGDYLTQLTPAAEWPSLSLKAKPKRLKFENYGRNFLPTEDICGDNDSLWEENGLKYLKLYIYFVEENACAKWKPIDMENASWDESMFAWRRVDAIEQNHKARTEIYEKIQNSEDKKATLTGKENKKKRNSTNKKIKELREKARAIPFAPKISLNKEAPDFQIRRKLFLETEKEKSFHYCSWCKKGMQNWKGCPCKTAWYCNEKNVNLSIGKKVNIKTFALLEKEINVKKLKSLQCLGNPVCLSHPQRTANNSEQPSSLLFFLSVRVVIKKNIFFSNVSCITLYNISKRNILSYLSQKKLLSYFLHSFILKILHAPKTNEIQIFKTLHDFFR